MNPPQRLPTSLTPLDVARNALLNGLQPVAPAELPLAEAVGRVAAEMPAPAAHPPRDVAAADGFAVRAHDLVGASAYAPVPLNSAPTWVEAGDIMPDGCNCVVDADSIDRSGPVAQAIAEAVPGQGVRRAGSDIAAGSHIAAVGFCMLPRDLLIGRAFGMTKMRVRQPRLSIVNIPGARLTADLIAESAHCAGAEVASTEAAGRDAASIANGFDVGDCDLLIAIGGSGVGRRDATLLALAARGEVIAHGIALQPGRTTAVGRIGRTPVVVLSGAPDQALAAWWTLALPALDRLSAHRPRLTLGLPLARKIASSVGLAEIVLLQRRDHAWAPLAAGELSLEAIAQAEAWLMVPGGSEGFAAGTQVDAYILRE
ncbi:MAG: molybdopterin-binding protein [Bradyrhizobium sp.]